MSYTKNGTIKPNSIKLRLCNSWILKGYCPRGFACMYAHGMDELHDGLCTTWLHKGYCPRGFACKFAHGIEELLDGDRDDTSKLNVICKHWFINRECRKGDACRFMHPPLKKMKKNDENLDRDCECAANVEENSSVRGGKKGIFPPDLPTSKKTTGKININCFLKTPIVPQHILDKYASSGLFQSRGDRNESGSSSSTNGERLYAKRAL
ncbi:unnamed protein product [Meloidogyne enterolobii]|uniref:Uncharacterized protein n=1 Tax=Meloidogyne enterolobii TaxID=390850 RepID=A0ACB1B8G3_MELEN